MANTLRMNAAIQISLLHAANVRPEVKLGSINPSSLASTPRTPESPADPQAERFVNIAARNRRQLLHYLTDAITNMGTGFVLTEKNTYPYNLSGVTLRAQASTPKPPVYTPLRLGAMVLQKLYG